MGRGRSKGSGGSAKSTVKSATVQVTPTVTPAIKDFDEAFGAGKNFERTGDVSHVSRSVSSKLQSQWNGYTDQFGKPLTSKESALLMKEWDPLTGNLYGYVRTTNSFQINKALYDPKNANKTDAQIFKRKDRKGQLRDLQTVKALDKAISTHKTPQDASYMRFGGENSIKATFGLSDAEMSMLKQAPTMSPAQLAQLNAMLSGKSSYSPAYTSTSANRSMNAFKDPKTKQAKGFYYERKISVPKGTNALAVKKNAQESEVIFGRNLQTRLTGVSISPDGHIVLHETYDGYR